MLSSAQQLLDDFNRGPDVVVGAGWTETETVASTGAQINASNQLVLASTTAGRDFIYQDVSGFYGVRLDTNDCAMTWAFNMRQTRASPSGFATNNYGQAVVLGSTSSNFSSAGQGYAVVFGGGTPSLRLVAFNGGLGGTLTAIATQSTNPGTAYLSVRVVYTPSTNAWQLYINTITAGTFSTANPVTTATTLIGSGTNSTYTGIGLPYMGMFWNHSTGAAESALFENIYIPVTCIPKVSFAATTGSTVEGNAGTITATVNMAIFPATVTGGNIVITVTYGPFAAVYGTDYTTSPAQIASTITVPVAAGATTASFDIIINGDLTPDANQAIIFTISNTTGDLLQGSPLVYTHTIIDNDGLPEVSFSTSSLSVLETAAGTYTFNLIISPAAPTAGNVTFTVTNGIGATCGIGQDYQVVGSGCPVTTFTVPIAVGATSLSFNVNVYDDAMVIEPTEQVTFTITGVPSGMAIAAAPTNSGILYIGDNDSPPTTLAKGDIAIVGVNANNSGCPGGAAGVDFISFMCFKDIVPGTQIILTDNGYERCNTGLWGNSEGTVRMTRTGFAIPAGQVITFKFETSGTSNVSGMYPDAAWTCATLGSNPVNMNNNGDQIFFMQGGSWINGVTGNHDAQYTGTVLFGFTTNPSFPWSRHCTSTPTQRSNLPPGMLCFSMAPTSSSDYAKYIGPLTTASQRDWIIRIANPSNWSVYANCSAYNAATPNWALAPILPISIASFTNGLWRGTVSTDWFDCKNWDDAEVPIATTNVRVDETATNHCVVGVTAGGTAVCASLVQTNSGTPRDLTIQNGSSLAVGGPITVQRTSVGAGVRLIVSNIGGSSTLTATDITVQGVTASVADATLWNTAPGNTVLFSGNLSIGVGGGVILNGGVTGGRISIGGNYSNAGPTEATLSELNGTIAFNGTGNQTISTSGFQDVFWELVLSKASGTLTLNNPLAIRDTIFFNTGLLNTSLTPGLLTMRAGSGWLNASNASFVNGPMEKIGDSNFSFPIGKGTALRPAGIRNISTGATNAFRAEYFPVSAYSFGTTLESTLHHVSYCEHWLIDRTSGSPNATIELTWRSPNSCGVTNLSELRVAQWEDSPLPGIWRDRGNGGTTGTFANGTITTAAVQSLFNASGTTPWTLASTTVNNPLPITLIDFSAKPEGAMVRLNWATASEYENALFTVERSRYGVEFERVVDVPGAVFSNVLLTYSDLDITPYGGLSYYRLKQTNTDGTFTYSAIVPVVFGGNNERPLVVFGREGTVTAVHDFKASSRYELLDMTGRIITSGNTTMDGRTELNGVDLSRGAYLFRLIDGERMESERFVY